jgi:ABC-type bacteriocin/lantibiotic exporter with double-glycine peptidase domain
MERIQQYLEIEHEKPAAEDGVPPAYWPSSGDLRVENLTARYSVDGPTVLNGLSFHVKSGERVGIGKVAPSFSDPR